jgi:hypothetical protein
MPIVRHYPPKIEIIQMSESVPAPRQSRASARPWLTPATAAEQAQVSSASVTRWCVQGWLPAKKVVGRWRIRPADLARLLAQGIPR